MKNILKISIKILVVCFVLTLVNCEKDDSESITKGANQVEYKIKEYSFVIANEIPKFKESFLKVIGDVTRSTNSSNERSTSELSIDSTSVKEIIVNGKTSYTMLVKNEEQEDNTFKNLVLEIDSLQVVKAYLITYNPTNIDYQDEHNSFSFEGTQDIEIIDYDSSFINLNMLANCTETFYCSWGGGIHFAGENCTAAYIFSTMSCGGGGTLPYEPDVDPVPIFTVPVITYDQLIMQCFLSNDGSTIIQDWLDDPDTGDIDKKPIANYLEVNTVDGSNCPSEEVLDFVVEAIEANKNSPFSVDLFEFAPDENIDLSQVETNKKFMCIYNKLVDSPSFKNLFVDTFNESIDMHITFQLSNNFPDSQAAVTSPDILNSASHQTITLNANHLNTKHPLVNAQTIIHEALHAFLNYKQSDGVCNPNNDGPSIYELESLTLGELLNDFNYNCIENATNSHNLMFNLLIPVMQQQLNEVFDDLVAQEDLNTVQYFYPPPNNTQHSFTWENALYYMSLVGLGEANSFSTTTNNVINEETSDYLFEQYNSLINNYNQFNPTIPPTFNYDTCNE